jgi:multidrug efflux pump subunit AcrA (membrane-fusion protein)
MTTYIPNAGPNLSSKRGWLRRRWGWWAGAVAVCVLAAGAYIFFAKPGQAQSRTAKPGQAQSTGKPGQNAGARSVPVAATAAKTGDVGVYLSGLGSVTPLNTVTVKSRVDGQLMRVVFREGQVVRAGDLLAEIDPRPFQVQLEQAVRWMPSIARAPRISRAGRCSPSITRSIMELLRVKTNAELVQQAIKLGLLAP